MTDCFDFLEKLEKESFEGTKHDPDVYQKWIHLKSKRDKLQTKLDFLERTEKQIEEEIETEVWNQKSKPRSEELDKRHQYLEDLLNLYRVTGVHVCHEAGNQFTVCLDASYYDTILESYHVEFRKRNGGYVIHRHSLPEFIPALQLEREHLAAGDIASFLSHIKTYLQAYVFKREELGRITKFIEKSGLSCDVQNTSSYDFTEIKLENSEQLYRFKLVFGLKNVLPDRVQIEEDSEIQRDIKEWKSLLLSKPLDSSVSLIVKDILNGL